MDTEDLQRILHEHRLWLNSGGEEGSYADLPGADLSEANLRGGNLRKADLREANLRGGNLSEANLRKAVLSEADLRGANLSEAVLWGGNLSEADLTGADLRGANLRGANLRGADLTRADLTRADLTRADLQGANLRGADLTGADLTGANLRGANLSEADLTGADLTGTIHLTQSQLNSADGDSRTQIPAVLQRPEHWLKAQPEPPKIPDPSPAPIRTTVRDNKVVLDAVEAESPAAPADRELHWDDLRDRSARLQNNASNHPPIQLTLERYADGLGASLADMQPILLGLRGLGLQELVEGIDEVMLSDSAASFRELLSSHQIFMWKFPEWQEYIDRDQEQPLSEQQQQAVKDVAPGIIQATRAQPSIIDQAISDDLDSLHQQADESRDPLVRKGVFDSLRNMFVSIARLATKIKKPIRAIVLFITLVGDGVSILIDLFPKEWGWVKKLYDYLRQNPPEE